MESHTGRRSIPNQLFEVLKEETLYLEAGVLIVKVGAKVHIINFRLLSFTVLTPSLLEVR